MRLLGHQLNYGTFNLCIFYCKFIFLTLTICFDSFRTALLSSGDHSDEAPPPSQFQGKEPVLPSWTVPVFTKDGAIKEVSIPRKKNVMGYPLALGTRQVTGLSLLSVRLFCNIPMFLTFSIDCRSQMLRCRTLYGWSGT